VVLPREVALHLRAGRAHQRTEPLPPPVEATSVHRPQVVDSTAAGQAYTALATVEELLKDWDEGGPSVLRAGGLSVRDLKRTAVALDVPEQAAAFWVELAYAAGLLATDGEADERYAATPAYDEWLELPAADRWTRLATAWLSATRTAGVVGGRDTKERTLAALGPGLDRSAAPEVRHRVLALLAALPEGGSASPDALVARLHWERALRGAASSDDLRSRIARWTLTEAESLGITGRGALSAHGRALMGAPPGATAPAPATGPGDKLPVHHRHLHHPVPSPEPRSPAEVASAAALAGRLLAPLLPEPLDHVLLQADLTAVAPGPLRRPLADVLDVLAD
ncbi:DNA-binding protein, partial [Streptomyces anthocyanicus]